MSSKHKEFTNPIIFFLSFVFIGYMVYWVFVDNYIKGEEIGKYNPHEEVTESDKKEEVENRYTLDAPSAESIAYGKSQFAIYCATCHGTGGFGDGPGSNSVPKPRNFHNAKDFKYGTTYANLLNTLKTGSPGTSMAPFDYLADDDKTALIHYISEWIPGRSMADLGSSAGTENTADAKSVQSNSAPVSLAVVKLSEQEIDQEIAKRAIKPTSKIVSLQSPVEDVLAQLISGDAVQLDVSAYSKLYVSENIDRTKSISSLNQFVSFINSDYVYNLTKMSFGTLTNEEARVMYERVKSKLN